MTGGAHAARRAPRRHSSHRTLGAAFIAAVLSVMPTFLLGGVAVLVRADLGFSESRLGLCISAYYLASGVTAVPAGRLAERLGGLRGCTVGILMSVATLLGIAALAHQWWQLALCLVFGGLANALLQSSTNLALAQGVPDRHQGLAFGLKLANGPTATLLAGMSASVIATTLGWRWAFVAMACIAVGFFVVRPATWRSETPPFHPEPGVAAEADVPPLALIALGCTFATISSASLVGFYVESAVADGLSVATAGWLLASGSVVGTVARGGWGWLVDRRGSSGYGLITTLLVVGAVAFGLLGAHAGVAMLFVATLLAFAAGWGWPGLVLFAVVRSSPGAPGKATGIAITGTSAGGIIGPSLFGYLVEHVGYTMAWGVTAACLLIAAVCIAAGAGLAARRIAA